MVVCLLTGLRIASDAPDAVISTALIPILPQGEIWTFHFIAGLVLMFCSVAYMFYVRRSGVQRRNALKRLVVFTLPAADRLRWAAVNVVLHWFLFAMVTVLTVSGIFLYIGHGGWIVTVHVLSAFGCLGYIVLHVVAHYFYGGIDELLRLFRPARLVANRAVRPLPLTVAAVAGLVAAGAMAALDFGTRDVLAVAVVEQAPTLDGRLDDAAWSQAESVRVLTQQGVNLAGTGESPVEIRALRHEDTVYFAFRWWDPTHSLWRLPIVKRADGWYVANERAAPADVNGFYEDKFSVAFAHSNAFGSADSTHMGQKPLSDKPGAPHERGLHYMNDDSYMDVWQWKSGRGGMMGMIDDQHFGPPVEPTDAHRAGKSRYKAGYASDPGGAAYKYNYKTGPAGYHGPIEVPRLPRDLDAVVAAMGTFELDSDTSVAVGSKWWMDFDRETVPYSAERDAEIPVGTVIPGVLITGTFSGDRGDLSGGASWKDGYWTLETARRLSTGSKYDIDFTVDRPIYMWVSVFDHNQVRHTRHVRPVTLKFD